MDPRDEPLDAEDRAVREVAGRVRRLRQRVAYAVIGLGVAAGVVGVWVLARFDHGPLGLKISVLVGFAAPALVSIAIAVQVQRLLLGRSLDGWIAEAAARHQVDRRSLEALVRAGVAASSR